VSEGYDGEIRISTGCNHRSHRSGDEGLGAAEKGRVSRLTRNPDKVTIRDAAFQVMEEAYQHASANGTLPANPRQIYYAARRRILEATDRDQLQSSYFQQTLLRDYMELNDCSHWDIIWDARGHFVEPHTARVVPLGTLEVRQHLGDRPKLGPPIDVSADDLYPTTGPKNRYKNILFVEKEGFDPILEAAQIANRFDVAIMSTKGMSVPASRLLLDRLVVRGVERVMVLHDFDISGFSIAGTLGTSSNIHRFENEVPIVDIGLRLDDVNELDLLSEPFVTDKDWRAVSHTLRRHGATDEEIRFLPKERVELNAMTSDEFILFIETKLAFHGIEKVIPDAKTIEQHARRVIERQLVQKAIEKLMPEITKQVASVALPEQLRQLLDTELVLQPELPWDAAISEIVQDLDLGELS
jgi:DNA topoisomerase VI subunit A